jgi:S-DNA-T family DNA segregation ATPase FtsK/SpoIIIE
MVELSVYNGIPHLLSPVVIEVDKAAQVLFWAVKEMERRYSLFNKANARDLTRYNAHLQKNGEKPLPTIVVIVDEMADLMMAAPEEVEKHICRLAQMARAVGIHLIIATQRPSVDVITGLIKANFPARIAFAVTSQTDSRVILDIPGAERLLGRGDMLFMAPDASKLERIQGTYLSDDEINKLVRYWKGIRTYEGSQLRIDDGFDPAADAPLDAKGIAPRNPGVQTGGPAGEQAGSARPMTTSLPPAAGLPSGPMSQPPLFEQIEQLKAADARDEFFGEAVRIVQEHGRASISLLQRKLRIGYQRAARLVDQLEAAGIVGPDPGTGQARDLRGEQPTDHQRRDESASSAPAPQTPSSSSAQRPRIIGGDDRGEGDAGAASASRSQFWW